MDGVSDQDLDNVIRSIRANQGRLPADVARAYGASDNLALIAKIERLVTFPFNSLPAVPRKIW
jgi:hypothetical protein